MHLFFIECYCFKRKLSMIIANIIPANIEFSVQRKKLQ